MGFLLEMPKKREGVIKQRAMLIIEKDDLFLTNDLHATLSVLGFRWKGRSSTLIKALRKDPSAVDLGAREGSNFLTICNFSSAGFLLSDRWFQEFQFL